MATSATFMLVQAGNRVEIATTIERLTNALDDLEADPDLEPNGDDEASLGWTDSMIGYRLNGADMGDDREHDTVDDEDNGDIGEHRVIHHGDRLYLVGGSQEYWAAGYCRDDRELDDEREPDPSGFGDEEGMLEEKGEPSLGWTLEPCLGSAGRLGALLRRRRG